MFGGVCVKQLLEKTLEDRLAYLINDRAIKQPQLMSDVEAVERKKELFARRQVEIVKAKAKTKLLDSALQDDGAQHVQYLAHLTYVCKDVDDSFYLEEQVEKEKHFFITTCLSKIG